MKQKNLCGSSIRYSLMFSTLSFNMSECTPEDEMIICIDGTREIVTECTEYTVLSEILPVSKLFNDIKMGSKGIAKSLLGVILGLV